MRCASSPAFVPDREVRRIQGERHRAPLGRAPVVGRCHRGHVFRVRTVPLGLAGLERHRPGARSVLGLLVAPARRDLGERAVGDPQQHIMTLVVAMAAFLAGSHDAELVLLAFDGFALRELDPHLVEAAEDLVLGEVLAPVRSRRRTCFPRCRRCRRCLSLRGRVQPPILHLDPVEVVVACCHRPPGESERPAERGARSPIPAWQSWSRPRGLSLRVGSPVPITFTSRLNVHHELELAPSRRGPSSRAVY